MLSRVASSVYWMQRYRERAENTARLIEATLNLNIDLPDVEKQWLPMLQALGADETYKNHYCKVDKDSVINFLTFDLRNPSSIFSCLIAAREHARSIREVINSEMWHELNTVYLFLQQTNGQISNHHNFYNRIKRQCQLFTGISDTTLSHGLAWHFGRVGYLLERADSGSRVLDIKYFLLLPSPEFIGTPFDNIQWNSLLASISALDMYRQSWHQVNNINVVEFVILDKEFPRSIFSCISRMNESLAVIKNSSSNAQAHLPYYICCDLLKKLERVSGAEIIETGLHEYLDEIQKELIIINNSVADTYFHRDLTRSKPLENRTLGFGRKQFQSFSSS